VAGNLVYKVHYYSAKSDAYVVQGVRSLHLPVTCHYSKHQMVTVFATACETNPIIHINRTIK